MSRFLRLARRAWQPAHPVSTSARPGRWPSSGSLVVRTSLLSVTDDVRTASGDVVQALLRAAPSVPSKVSSTDRRPDLPGEITERERGVALERLPAGQQTLAVIFEVDTPPDR